MGHKFKLIYCLFIVFTVFITVNHYYFTCVYNLCFSACPLPDVVFVVEATTRVTQTGSNNFQSDLQFIQCVVNQLQIGVSNVQVGLLTFADTVRNTFFLNSYSSQASLQAAISSAQFIGGSANIAAALNEMTNTYYLTGTSGSRSGRPRIAVLLEHGSTQSGATSSLSASDNAKAAAATAKSNCINIIGVGVYLDGQSASYTPELSAISSWPNQFNYNYFTATSYAQLNQQCTTVAQQILNCFQCCKFSAQFS